MRSSAVGRHLLAAREMDVIQLACEGLSDQQMAERLGIGVETVGSYWRRIFKKLHCGARTEAVAIIVREICLDHWQVTELDSDPSNRDPRLLGVYARNVSRHLPDYMRARRAKSLDRGLAITKSMLGEFDEVFLNSSRLARAEEMGSEPYVPFIRRPGDSCSLLDLDRVVCDLFRATQ